MAIAGGDLPCEAKEFLSEKFEVTILESDQTIAGEVSAHADMILCIFDGKLFCHSSYYERNKDTIDRICSFAGLSPCPSDCERYGKYPNDVSFNALCLDNAIICRKESVATELLNYPIINTKQGYAGCTALWAANTVVTADPATIKACSGAGIPYHKISGEDIYLKGYDTGFIGGACGVCGNTVYICGDYRKSRSGMELYDFCQRKELRLVSIYSGPVTDMGGIKFVSLWGGDFEKIPSPHPNLF